MSSLRNALALLAVISSAACSGKTLDVGSSSSSSGGSGSSSGSTGDGGGDAGGGSDIVKLPPLPPLPPSATPPFDAASFAAARAQCNEPHGPVDPYQGGVEVATKLVGSWVNCTVNPQQAPFPDSWLAVEFAPDGTLDVLIDDGAGGLKAGQGVDTQGTWTLYTGDGYDAPVTDIYLGVDGVPHAAAGTPQFETGPRRFVWNFDSFPPWFAQLVRQ